jgi:hypothetical protein
MPLPEMPPLQFLVVHLLFAGRQASHELRAKMLAEGVKISQPCFSRLIQRMEFAGYLRVRYETRTFGSRTIRECCLDVTDLGVGVWGRVREFYAQFAPPPRELVPVATKEGQLADLPRQERKDILLRQSEKEIKRVYAGFLRNQ